MHNRNFKEREFMEKRNIKEIQKTKKKQKYKKNDIPANYKRESAY